MEINRIGGYLPQNNTAGSRTEKSGKNFSDLLRETNSTQAAQQATLISAPEQRRQIASDTAHLWQSCSRQWRAESAGMGFTESVLYCEEKAEQWVTELMREKPAMFRQWLAWEQETLEETGLDNAILPEGFTEADKSRWLAKDVLEYL